MNIEKLNSELELKKEENVDLVKKMQDQENEREARMERGANFKREPKQKGRFETTYYNTNVHEYNESMQQYVAFENTIKESADHAYFCIQQRGSMIRIPKDGENNALFSIEQNGCLVNVFSKADFGAVKGSCIPKIDAKMENIILYSDVSPDADYSLRPTCHGVQFTVEAKDITRKNRFSFCFEGKGVKWQRGDNEKTLRFFSVQTGALVFEIPTPYMKDANGRYSEDVNFEVIAVDEQNCLLTMIPDFAWLSSEECAYPVNIEWAMLSDFHRGVGMEFARKDLSADGRIKIGGNGVPVRLQMPKPREGMITKSIKALFHCDSVPGGEDKQYMLALYRVDENTVNESPQESLVAYTAMHEDQQEYALNVTSEQGSEDGTMYSLRLCELQEGELTESSGTEVAVMNVSELSSRAVYSVEESEASSQDDSSGLSGNLGSVGSYKVDLVQGYLNMELKDFDWEGNRMPVSIFHSYFSAFASSRYVVVDGNKSVFGSVSVGKGWRLNLMQSMVNTGIQSEYDNKDTYTYIDEANEKLVFVEYEDTSETACCDMYKDVNNLGYTYNANTGVLKKGDMEYYFTSGRLTRIIDRFGNTMLITYDSGDHLTSVTDGVGRKFDFTYQSERLSSIQSPNGTSINYTYENGYLKTVTYPNGQTLTFTYSENNSCPMLYECC